MAFENHSTEKLKSYQSIFLAIAIIGFCLLSFLTGIVIYGITHGKDSTLLAVIPALLFPAVILPFFGMRRIRKELKIRESS